MRLTTDDALARHVTVTLDGVDVTNYCAMADEQGGSVELFKSTLGDFTFLPPRGTVVIALKPDAPEWVKIRYLRRRMAEASNYTADANWGWPAG
jgi:hypothetical protein